MTEISIIIPIYNAEKYLPKCLDALINQTYKDIEIICINDGSTDNSLKILNQYSLQDKRIKVQTQANSGPAIARNLGLKIATGKYLMFCDSDDWYEPDMCEVMHKTIISQKVDVVVCGCHIIEEDDNGRPQGELAYYQNKYEKLQDITPKLIKNTNVLLWNKIFKNSLIQRYNIKFPIGYMGEDSCFYWQYMSVAQTAYYLSDKLYNYLRRGNSIMGQVFSKSGQVKYDTLYALEYYYKFLCSHKLQHQKSELFKDLYIENWHFCTSFMTEKQYDKAYKIFKQFCETLPQEQAKQLKQIIKPHYALRIGNFKIMEFSSQKFIEEGSKQLYFDMRLTLFSKINLFNISQKKSLLRGKILGLCVFKMKK